MLGEQPLGGDQDQPAGVLHLLGAADPPDALRIRRRVIHGARKDKPDWNKSVT
ncbi:hypothetical protein Acsp02_03070 [Actinoplanes sp. NBRC 103695]|nr:hypothetical protein Acsp02_03070 [Actinoplanes sp. NBRC 103695]